MPVKCFRFRGCCSSDLQKSLTDTGLTPSPARWDVQINPTLSVIALTCSLPYRIIIKRFCLLVKVFFLFCDVFLRCLFRLCRLLFACLYFIHATAPVTSTKTTATTAISTTGLLSFSFLSVVVPVFSVPFVIVGFSTDFFIIQRYICLPYDLSFIGICNGSLIDGTILCFNFPLSDLKTSRWGAVLHKHFPHLYMTVLRLLFRIFQHHFREIIKSIIKDGSVSVYASDPKSYSTTATNCSSPLSAIVTRVVLA